MRAKSNNKSRKEKKSLISSSRSTEAFLKVYGRLIKNPVMRKQTISFIRAVDGKKIRNTSGV